MGALSQCTECGRHVRRTEARCPFCKGAVSPGPEPLAVPLRGLSRAAIVALGVGATSGEALAQSGLGALREPPPGAVTSGYGIAPPEPLVQGLVEFVSLTTQRGSRRVPAPEAFTARVRLQLRSLRACYERALRNNPSLGGPVTVDFTLDGNGAPTDPHGQARGELQQVVPCMVGFLRRMSFESATENFTGGLRLELLAHPGTEQEVHPPPPAQPPSPPRRTTPPRTRTRR